MSDTKETRLYEVGFLLTPQLTEAEVLEQVEAITGVLTKNDGTITNTGTPEFIDLSYTMEKIVGSSRNKYRQAYFGWVKFEATPEAVAAVKTALDAQASIIRYILLKTDAENSVVFKKPKESPRREALEPEINLDELEEETPVEEHEKLPELSEDVVDAVPLAEDKEV